MPVFYTPWNQNSLLAIAARQWEPHFDMHSYDLSKLLNDSVGAAGFLDELVNNIKAHGEPYFISTDTASADIAYRVAQKLNKIAPCYLYVIDEPKGNEAAKEKINNIPAKNVE